MIDAPHEIEQSFELWLRLHISTQKALRREGPSGVPSVLERYKVSPEQWERASAGWWSTLRDDRKGGGSRRLRLFEQAMVRLDEQGTRTVTPFAGDKTGVMAPDSAMDDMGDPVDMGRTVARMPRHPSPLPFAAQDAEALPFRQEIERLDPVVQDAHPALGGTAKGEISPLYRRVTPFEAKAPVSQSAPSVPLPPAVSSVPAPSVPVPHPPVPSPSAASPVAGDDVDDVADDAAAEAALAADAAAPPTPVSDGDVVEDLRRLGANDDYIARVLARRAGGGGAG